MPEIVIPLESAKKRARFAIGIVPPFFRSSPFPFASEPRKPSGGLKSVALRASRRSRSGWSLASRSTATSGGAISSEPAICRKSKATFARIRCERSGVSRHSEKTSIQRADGSRQSSLLATTPFGSSAKPHCTRPCVTSAVRPAKYASASGLSTL